MAEHLIADGDIALHSITLTPNVEEIIRFARDVGEVEIISDGTEAVYHTRDNSPATVRGANTRVIPKAAVSVYSADLTAMGTDIIRLISEGSPTLHIQLT